MSEPKKLTPAELSLRPKTTSSIGKASSADSLRLMKALTLLCEAFSRHPTEATFLAYEIGLADMPIEQVEQAALECLRSSKFMPTVSELRGKCPAARPVPNEPSQDLLDRLKSYGCGSFIGKPSVKPKKPAHCYADRTKESLMQEIYEIIKREEKEVP